MTDFLPFRIHMIQSQLQPNGVIMPAVLDAFERVPRDSFVPAVSVPAAYTDRPIDMGQGRALMDPVTLAKMVQELRLQKGDTVLVIGGMAGYTSAILSDLGALVTDYEPDSYFKDLFDQAGQAMDLSSVTRVYGAAVNIPKLDDGYDAIIIDGAAGELPYDLLPFVRRGGKIAALVVPSGARIGQVCMIEKTMTGHSTVRSLFDSYAPYVPGFAPARRFEFS